MSPQPEMIGHERVRELLASFSGVQGAAPHAILLTGPTSVGKRTVARTFLQQLHCLDHSAPEACSTCRACQLLPVGKLIDAQLLDPEGSKISIAEVRALQERVSRTAIEGGRKSVLIADAERLTTEAANALLKTLEEPPSDTTLVLTASSADVLLPTIVSRCSVLPLRTVPKEMLRTHLLRRSLDPARVELALVLADGRPGRAIRFLEQEDDIQQALVQAKAVGGFSSQSLIDKFAVAKELSDEERERVDQLLDAWTSLLRLALLTKVYPEEHLPPELQQELHSLLEKSQEQLLQLLKRTLETREAVRENANIRLSLESLLLAF